MNNITDERLSGDVSNSGRRPLEIEGNESEMNDVEILKRDLHARFPQATLTLDAPLNSASIWYVDIRHGKRGCTIQWRPDSGFGLSTTTEGYGEGADEVYAKREQVENRVAELLSKKPLDTKPAALANVSDAALARIAAGEALAGLPARWQHVLRLRFFEGYSINEIAEILGTTTKYTQKLVTKSLRRAEEVFMASRGDKK